MAADSDVGGHFYCELALKILSVRLSSPPE